MLERLRDWNGTSASDKDKIDELLAAMQKAVSNGGTARLVYWFETED